MALVESGAECCFHHKPCPKSLVVPIPEKKLTDFHLSPGKEVYIKEGIGISLATSPAPHSLFYLTLGGFRKAGFRPPTYSSEGSLLNSAHGAGFSFRVATVLSLKDTGPRISSVPPP